MSPQLGQPEHGDVQLHRQLLQTSGDVADLNVPLGLDVVRGWLHQLHIVYDDDLDAVVADETAGVAGDLRHR